MDKSHILPPCRVCNSPSSGFHYGVNSCEACKAFFRRTFSKGIEYECAERECCDVSYENRNNCAFCRYQKCLTVGMCKDAIKTGRYSHAQRASNIREIRKLRAAQQDNVSDSASTVSASEICAPNSLESNEPVSEDITDFTSTSELSERSDQSFEGLLSSNSPNSHDGAVSSQLNMVVNELESCQLSGTEKPCRLTEIVKPCRLSGGKEPGQRPVEKPLFDVAMVPVYEEFIERLKNLNQQFFSDDIEPSDALSDLEIERLEMVELKQKVFGSLTPMTLDEFITFYRQTGIDIDGRKELLEGTILPRCDMMIKHHIAFSKTIPGFNDISLADQIGLIKASRLDFFLIARHQFFRPEHKLFTPCSGKVVHIEDMMKIKGHLAESVFKLQERLQSLRLRAEETALLCALSIMSTDSCNLEDSGLVETSQNFLLECLFYLFHKNHPNQKLMFPKTVSYLTELRNLREESYKWEVEMVNLWFGIINIPPLIHEMWSG